MRALSGKYLATLALLCWSMVFSVSAQGQEREIVILGNESKIPKIFLSNGDPQGILIDISRAIDKKLDGYVFRFELYPWARAFHMAENGQGGIIGLSMTRERLEIFDYSDPVYYDDVIVVVRRGREFPFESMNDLRGMVVGIGLAGTFGDDFDQAVASGLFSVDPDNGDVARLKKLLAGRIDCALISPGVQALNHLLTRDEYLLEHRDEFVALPVPLKRDPNYLGFAQDMHMQPFLEAFNAALAELRDSGELDRIVSEHLGR